MIWVFFVIHTWQSSRCSAYVMHDLIINHAACESEDKRNFAKAFWIADGIERQKTECNAYFRPWCLKARLKVACLLQSNLNRKFFCLLVFIYLLQTCVLSIVFIAVVYLTLFSLRVKIPRWTRSCIVYDDLLCAYRNKAPQLSGDKINHAQRNDLRFQSAHDPYLCLRPAKPTDDPEDIIKRRAMALKKQTKTKQNRGDCRLLLSVFPPLAIVKFEWKTAS